MIVALRGAMGNLKKIIFNVMFLLIAIAQSFLCWVSLLGIATFYENSVNHPSEGLIVAQYAAWASIVPFTPFLVLFVLSWDDVGKRTKVLSWIPFVLMFLIAIYVAILWSAR